MKTLCKVCFQLQAKGLSRNILFVMSERVNASRLSCAKTYFPVVQKLMSDPTFCRIQYQQKYNRSKCAKFFGNSGLIKRENKINLNYYWKFACSVLSNVFSSDRIALLNVMMKVFASISTWWIVGQKLQWKEVL